MERGKRVKRAFGKHDMGSQPRLRSFERYLRIPAREGEGAWRSDFVSVQNLLDHLARFSKSESSRRKYLNLVKNFCKWAGQDPDELIGLPKRRIEQLVQDFVDEKARDDCSKRYLNTIIKRLRTFFRQNGMELDVKRYYVPSRYRKRPEYVPTKDEVHSMADATNGPRDRAMVVVSWNSGVRPSDLIALNYGDIVDEIENDESYLKIDIHPGLKDRVPNACKGRVCYYTFISPVAVSALKSYLREREHQHGAISRDEPLFQSQWNLWSRGERIKKRVTAKRFRQIVKEAARRAGISKWKHVTPHCLRKAFKSVLRSPTKDGGRMDEGVQRFLMGHIQPGSEDPYYDVTKVDFHRDEYARLDFSRGTDSFQRDKVVEMRELEVHLEKGWLYVERLDDDRVVVRRG